jgi:uncharacterized protein (DUF2267 family)
MLRLLFKLWILPLFGTMFAAGADTLAGVDGGGGADGADSGDSGGADGGGDSGDGGDGGAGDGAAADADRDQTDDSQAGGEGDKNVDPDAPVDLGDGRQVPGRFKKLFDLAAKAGLGREAKQLYFANQRLEKAIPGGVNAAIELARQIEDVGGIEGIEEMQDKLGVYAADAQDFESNPQKWVESGFAENEQAALKAFVYSLDFVADKFPDHYTHTMAKVITNDLGNVRITDIYRKLAALKDDPEAKALTKELADYWNSRIEQAKKAPENKPDAKSKELMEREERLHRQEIDNRYKDVNRAVFPALKTAVTKSLQAHAKEAGIDLQKLSKDYPAEWRDLLNDIQQRIMRSAIKDKRFVEKYADLVEANDLKRAERAINAKHDALVPDAVREAVRERGLFRGKKKTAAPGDKNRAALDGGNSSTNAGWTQVSEKPARHLIDWDKTTQSLQLDGKYILKDGKKVVVKY